MNKKENLEMIIKEKFPYLQSCGEDFSKEGMITIREVLMKTRKKEMEILNNNKTHD